jgi:transcriptional regulator with XRE-family HTH domain
MAPNDRLKSVRQRLNLSQGDFAKALNMNQSNVSALEKGNRRITPAIASKIQAAFNVSPEWLYTGDGEMFSGNILSDIDIDRISNISQVVDKKKAFDRFDVASDQDAILSVTDQQKLVWKIERDLRQAIKSNNEALLEVNEVIDKVKYYTYLLAEIESSYFWTISQSSWLVERSKHNTESVKDTVQKDLLTSLENSKSVLPMINDLKKALERFFNEFATSGLDSDDILDTYKSTKD